MLKPIRERDRKAPRFRWSSGRYSVLNQHLFDNYVKEVENPIKDYQLFKSLILDFNNELKEEAINNRDGVKLPAMMGILAVASFKIKRRDAVDWVPSMAYLLKIKEQNLHTGGLSCKIVYSIYTAKYKFKNWALWRFEGNRDFKTRVSNSFVKNYQLYKRMDNKTHVSKMFRDDHVTTYYHKNDNIGANIISPGNEQVSELGCEDNG